MPLHGRVLSHPFLSTRGESLRCVRSLQMRRPVPNRRCLHTVFRPLSRIFRLPAPPATKETCGIGEDARRRSYIDALSGKRSRNYQGVHLKKGGPREYAGSLENSSTGICRCCAIFSTSSLVTQTAPGAPYSIVRNRYKQNAIRHDTMVYQTLSITLPYL